MGKWRRGDWPGQQHRLVCHLHKCSTSHGEISGDQNTKTSCQGFVPVFVPILISYTLSYLTEKMDFGCTGGCSAQQGDDRLGLQERRPPKFDRVSGRHRSLGLGGQGEADVWGRNADCGSNNFPDSPSQIVALNFCTVGCFIFCLLFSSSSC